MKKRPEIDALSALFFLLVVFIHVSSEPILKLNRQSAQFALIMIPWSLAAFVMQGFVFLSGLKLFLSEKAVFNYPRFMRRRFLKIYAPFALWTAVYYIYFWRRQYFDLSWPGFGKYLLLGNIVSPFYFIAAVMQFYLLMPLWRAAVKRLPPLAGIGLALAVTLIAKRLKIPYNDRLFPTYLLFWAMGCYIGREYDVLRERLAASAWPLLLSAAAAGALDAFLKYRSMALGLTAPFQEELHLLYCALAVLSLTLLFSAHSPRALQLISSAGFTVFLSHVLFINVVNELLDYYRITRLSARFGVRVVSVYALSLLLGLIWGKLRAKARFPS